jgi:hypothetical protein
VGLFAHWVSVKGAAEALEEAGYGETVVEAETPGWLTGHPRDDMQLPDWDDFDEAVARVAASAGGPALSSWVYDSDVGYLAAVDDSGALARLVVNPDACEAYDLPLPEGWPDGAITRFAEWSRSAPKALEATAIAEVVGRDWTFAEEGVRDLHESLALSAPYEFDPEATVPTFLPRATVEAIDARGLGGYEAPLPWMTESLLVGSRVVPWREARHVPGAGADFIGIWDRESPEEPIARFPLSSRGDSEAMDELNRLLEPLVRADLGGEELEGFERSFHGEHTFRLVARELRWKDARYVGGYGSGYLGIWDRERPKAPIEQFPADHAGLMRAYESVGQLLFEDVLAGKELPGLRLYLPRVEPHMVKQEIPPGFLEQIQGLSPEQRAAWEENLERGSWVRSPAGPWLITEEEEDEAWPPSVSGTGRFYLYASGFTGEANELNFICQGNFATAEEARETASRRYAQGEWRTVPDEVSRNLLETVRWLLADG